MKLLVTGVSHKTAPVEIREQLAFREDSLPAALADLKSSEGVAEAVILSTCNRVEITVATDDRSDPQAIVDAFLRSHKPANLAASAPNFYRRQAHLKHCLRLICWKRRCTNCFTNSTTGRYGSPFP